jgi:hypothetical protein
MERHERLLIGVTDPPQQLFVGYVAHGERRELA